jgi:hypothetical protein
MDLSSVDGGLGTSIRETTLLACSCFFFKKNYSGLFHYTAGPSLQSPNQPSGPDDPSAGAAAEAENEARHLAPTAYRTGKCSAEKRDDESAGAGERGAIAVAASPPPDSATARSHRPPDNAHATATDSHVESYTRISLLKLNNSAKREFLFRTFGVVENNRFNFSKTPESRLASSAGGREEPKPSLPLKLHRRRKRANITK